MNITHLSEQIVNIQQQRIALWKQTPIEPNTEGFLRLVEENHAFNFRLWHAEDKARRDDLGFEFVYHAKREIDHYNQQRNNRIEAMDDWLFHHLQPSSPLQCSVHSETPGMMIDRLSILALKHYHMKQQTTRTDVSDEHHQACMTKVNVIQEQLEQLQHCLTELFTDIQNKTRTFRIYRQFKMYNDPTLNPELYRNKEMA